MKTHLVYGYRLSYFTRKVEAAFECSGLPYQHISKTLWRRRRVERLGGTHQVPVVRTPEGRWLSDSTPIITYLDSLECAPPLHGQGAQGVLIRAVEEWLDEWLPRTVMHYRWNLDECALSASDALARELLPVAPAPIRRLIGRSVATWGRKACRALGVDNPTQQEAAVAESEALFAKLDAQLAITPYAMGERPTAVDATLLGALRAHFLADPVPRRALRAYPRLVAWAEATSHVPVEAPLPSLSETTDFGEHVLKLLVGPYHDYLLANAHALEAREKSFVIDTYGSAQSYLARVYPETSRRLLQGVISALEPEERDLAEHWLARRGLKALFSPQGTA